ncbi:MAG: YitT family protein [Coprococcus phoceensis]
MRQLVVVYDIVGIYCSKKFPDFSVGKLTLLVNAAIYSFGALNNSLETAIYSIIFCYAAQRYDGQNPLSEYYDKCLYHNKDQPQSYRKSDHF